MNKTLTMLIFAVVVACLWFTSLPAAAGLAASPLTQVTIVAHDDPLFGDKTQTYFTSTHFINFGFSSVDVTSGNVTLVQARIVGRDEYLNIAIGAQIPLNKQSVQTLDGVPGTITKGSEWCNLPGGTLRVYEAEAVGNTLTRFAAQIVSPTLTVSLYYNSVVHPQIEDTSPPRTEYAVMGPIGTFGRYSGPVTISLSADDPDGINDVATTYYEVNDDTASIYRAPIVISSRGLHMISYWSVDKTGNVEDLRERSLWIGTELIRPQPQTFFMYSSEYGEFVGNGKQEYLAPPSYTFSSRVTQAPGNNRPNFVEVSLRTPGFGEYWTSHFSTLPTLQDLTPARVHGTRSELVDHVVMDISGNYRSGSSSYGSFTILDMVTVPGDWYPALESFGAAFEQHGYSQFLRADGGRPALYGAVFYNSKAVPIYPKQVTLSDGLLPGGKMTATVTLSDPAPGGGQFVKLSCDQPAIVPASVIVPANSRSATFPVTLPLSVNGLPVINVRATCGKITTVSYFHVIATNYLASISVAKPEYFGAGRSTGTVTSAAPAGVGGMLISLTSDNSYVVVPATVKIPEGQATATFAVTYTAPLVEQVVTVAGAQDATTVRTAFVVEPYKPVIASLSPSECNVASGTVSVTITGSHFANDDTVMLSGKPVNCQVLSDSTISFEIASGLLQTAGILPVTVVNNNGAGSSNTVNFTVTAPTPVINSVTPTTYAPGDAAIYLDVYGDNFMPNTVIKLNGKPVTSWLMAANRLEATLNTDLQRTPTVTVTVSTPAPGGGESNAIVINNVAVKTFNRGLSLVSVPADYSATAISDVFGYADPKMAVWVAGVNAYDVTPTGAANSLVPGRGYWIRFPHTVNILTAGTPTPTTAPFTIPLVAGWNMIGSPFLKTVALSSCTITLGGSDQSFDSATAARIVGAAYGYDAASNKYVTANSLSPYVGYWLYAALPCVLSVPAP